MESSLDFLTCALEEIALEGLDGITLPSLWVRLENRPNFNFSADESSKKFFWECVAVHKEIEIYKLPHPRPTVQLYNRYEIIDPELGVFMEPKDFQKDVYPVAIVDDHDYRGSCETYKTRVCITSKIRHSNMLLVSLSQALEEYGERLVLVSSPRSRLIALIGMEVNPLCEFNKESYVVLERIGRSRYHGETTHGKMGLLSLKPVKDHLHYYLSKLHSKGLVTKQKHYLKNAQGKCVTGHLFHLTRFFVRRKPKFDVLLEMMYDILKNKPNNQELSKVLREQLGLSERTFKKVVYRSNQKWFQFCEVPFSVMCPDSTPEQRFTTSGTERIAKVVRMVQPYDDNEEFSYNSDSEDISQAYVDLSKLHIDKHLSCVVYHLMEKAGHNGLSLNDIIKELTLPRLEIRQICRRLVKSKDVITVMVDRGRQRVETYICKKFENESECCMKIKEQTKKLKDIKSKLGQKNSKTKKVNHVNSTVASSNIATLNNSLNTEVTSEVKNQSTLNSNESALTGGTEEIIEATKMDSEIHSVSNQVTARVLNRCNKILEHLKEYKIATLFELYTAILSAEREEGYNFKVDKKSLLRLLTKLSKDGHVKIMKTELKQGERVKKLEFICDPTLEADNPVIRSSIEQAKFKFFGADKEVTKTSTSKRPMKDVANVPKPKKIKQTKEPGTPKEKPLKILAAYGSRKLYGLPPKFIRAKTLHYFLFYLVYDYEGISDCTNRDDPFVYHDSESWKRYLPPLSEYARKGWFILADVIPYIPLSIFVKVINMIYEIPALNEILADQEKKHYLIKHLPQDLQNNILNGRRYVFKLYDVLNTLCYMGLISFGPKASIKEKEQVYIYVHQHSKIKDTTASPSGYMQVDKNIDYEVKEYAFETLNDLETFWIDLENVCTCTPLGRYSSVSENEIQNETSQLGESLQNKEFDEVQDTGDIPGDGLGAAGLDSSLFSHLRRNWCWINQNLKPSVENKVKLPSITRSMTLQRLLEEGSQHGSSSESRKRLHRMTKKVLDPPNRSVPSSVQMTENVNTVVPSESPSKKRKGNMKQKKPKRLGRRRQGKQMKRPYYDEKDIAAMKVMDKMRTDWTAEEDSFLLVCKVTSVFLDPKYKRMVVPFSVIRDLLYEKVPHLSSNKTSRACQRRLRYMLFNSDTRNSVAAFLGEALQDAAIVKEFDIPKPPKTKEEVWKKMFKSLFYKLVDKYTSSPSDSNKVIVLPDSLNRLEDQYSILTPKISVQSSIQYQEPESLDDIHYDIIRSLVLLALASVDYNDPDDGSVNQNWSYHLYKLYEQYPEFLLRSVIEKFSKELLITKKTSYKRRKSNSLRIHMPYRFSVIYENNFITKYPSSLYTGANVLLKKLTQKNEFSDKTKLDEVPSGYSPVLMALSLLKQIEFYIKLPEHIIVLSLPPGKKQPLNAVEQMKSCVNDEDSHQLIRLCHMTEKSDTEDEDSADKKNKGTEFEESAENSKNRVLRSNESLSEAQVHTSSSRLVLNMLRQETAISKLERCERYQDYIALNPCQLSCEMQTSPENPSCDLILNPKKVMQKSVQNMKCSYIAGKEYTFSNEIAQEIIAEHSSYLPQEMFTWSDFSSVLCKTYEAHNSAILIEGEKIFSFICRKTSIGVSYKDLWMAFDDRTRLPLSDHLTLLSKSMLILRVGIVSFRYVWIKYSKPWVLSSFLNMPPQALNSCMNIEGKDSVVPNTHRESLLGHQSKLQINSETKLPIETIGKQVLDSILEKCEIDISSSEESDSLKDTTTNVRTCEKSNAIQNTTFKNEEYPSTSRENNIKRVKTECLKSVYFLPRVWRRPDGSFNKFVFLKYLRTILSYIMSTPGVTEENLRERFSLLLPPVQTFELIEVLLKINCIFKYFTKKIKPLSLFSPRNELHVIPTPQPEDDVHYEPHPDAILKMLLFEKVLYSD